MPNITLNVDEKTVKSVRKIAIDKNTTLTAMIRDFLHSVADKDRIRKELAISRLRQTFSTYSQDMGERKWSREDLHER